MRKSPTLLFLMILCWPFCGEAQIPCLNPEHPARLPAEIDGRRIPREIGCWFPKPFEVQQDGYQGFIDAIGPLASYDLICVSSRHTQNESNLPESLEFQRKAATYAWEKYGIRMLPDAEIRLARKAFQKAHPNRLQERLQFREAVQKAGKPLVISLEAADLLDHYTHNYPYTVEGVRFLRAWTYQKNEQGEILPETVKIITDQAAVSQGEKPNACEATFSGEQASTDRFVCAVAAFAFLYPDVHSDEALAFEREIFKSFASLPAGGAVKDEWGFLPCFTPTAETDQYYFSETMAARYSKISEGRELLEDCFLISRPQAGRNAERTQALDRFQRMNLDQLLRFEHQLYQICKEQWGPMAFPATHPTWYAYPGVHEFRKNSLFWWQHPRDNAQTDEFCPYPCRTGMSKVEGRLWFNEYYADEPWPYLTNFWRDFLSGGRMNIHPLCCMPDNPLRKDDNYGVLPILNAGAEKIRQRIRLVNLISDAPLYSPVAVVFGHYGVMNWTRPEFNTVDQALALCGDFASSGFPADLIPSSEMVGRTLAGKPRWKLNENGFLQYGVQEYRLVVFFAVTDSDRQDFETLSALNRNGKTRIITWRTDVSPDEQKAVLASLREELQNAFISKQSPWNANGLPNLSGMARLTDGTLLWACTADASITGVPLVLQNEKVQLTHSRTEVTLNAQATGVLACRFDAEGKLTALAASDLKQFVAGGVALEIPEGADLALWQDAKGNWKGVFQGPQNSLPDGLKKFPADWRYLQIP